MDPGSVERLLSMVRENALASSVRQVELEFEECEKELELKEVSLRKWFMELKEKEERLKVVEEKEKNLELRENSITQKRKESDAKQFREADLARLVFEMQVKEMVSQLEGKEKSLGLLQDSTSKKHEALVREVEAKKESVDLLDDSMAKKHEALMKKLEALKEEVGLVEDSLAKKNEGLMRELESWKDEVGLVSKSIDKKSYELVTTMNGFDVKQTEESEKRKKEAKRIVKSLKKLEAKEKELNSLNKTIEKKTIELKKKEEKFKLKQKSGTKKIKEKEKILGAKEKELKEKENKLKLKQRDLEEGSKSRKRSRVEFGSSSLPENDIDPDYLYLLEKKQKHNHNGETDLALVLEGTTSCAVDEIVCLDSEPFNCPDPDFNEFSNTMSSFAKGQVWALYDPIDDMPRYYGRIKTVSKLQPSVQVTWLESVHNTPIACGRFKKGDSENKSHLMFSHEMNPIVVGKSFFINPLIGETWALFRDWNKTWNTTKKELHKPPYKYDFVEVLTEFDEVQGIAVAYLGRVEGFTSVFERRAAEEHRFISEMISPGAMFRFSHRVPSVKLSGDEKEGVPAGSFELDPAALPRGLFGVRKEEALVLV